MIEDPQIISAIISAGATLIATLVGGLIGKRFLDQRKIQADLDRAIKDIHFLLQVEKRHCEIHIGNGFASNLRNARKYAKNHTRESWSGRFTPGREGLRVQA